MTEKQLKYRQMGLEASYLAACALHNTVPQVNQDLDVDELYQFCKFHSITSIVAMALDEVWKGSPADEEIMKKWRQARDKAIRKNILLNAERERILAHLESIGCWYMPLKGSLMQFEYPQFGMRQMSDNDILVDPEKSVQIRDFMVQNGYDCVQFLQGHHDEYNRKPVYNFEIHRALFRKEEAPKLADYYANIRQRLEKDENNRFGYHMSWSDFYIYMIAHAYNHFQESGIGIRFLMDVYVFHKNHAADLDPGYVERELEKLDALKFDQVSRELARLLFADPERTGDFSETELEAMDAFFSSGAFGTEDQLLKKNLDKNIGEGGSTRAGYFLRRLFPPRELLGVMYPVVKKHKWLTPFVWIYRLVRTVFSRPGRMIREAKSIVSAKTKNE